MKLTTTKEASKSGANILVYGRSGLGKTRLCGTCNKPLIISSEKKFISVSEYDIPVLEISSAEDLKKAYKFVTSPKARKFKTICLDSLSDIAETILSDYTKQLKDGRQIYGQLADFVARYIRKFRDLKVDTYFIAKIGSYENDSNMTAFRPNMPGKNLTENLPFFFDEVFVLRKSGEDEEDHEGYLYLQTQASLLYDAKDSSGKLKKEEKPDLNRIFKKIKRRK